MRSSSFRLLGALLCLASSACDGQITVVPHPVDKGHVEVFQYLPVSGGPPAWSTFHASFATGVVETCVIVDEEGACRLLDCRPRAEEPPAPVDAGIATLTGGLVDVATAFDELQRRYPPTEVSGPLFEGGEPLQLDVAGSDAVAPLSVTLQAPIAPVVTAPDSPVEVDRSQPLPFTWTSSGGEGTITARLWNAPES